MKNSCSNDDRLNLLHDGELDPVQADRLKAHLDGCETCSGSLRQIQTISGQFARLPLGEITSAEQARIHQAVRHAQLGFQERAVLQLGYALAALAASMLVVSSLWLADNISGKGGRQQAVAAPADWQIVAPSLAADMRLSTFMVRGLGKDDRP